MSGVWKVLHGDGLSYPGEGRGSSSNNSILMTSFAKKITQFLSPIGSMHSSAILDSKRGCLPKQVLDNRFSMVNCCVPHNICGLAFRPNLQYSCIPNISQLGEYIYIVNKRRT